MSYSDDFCRFRALSKKRFFRAPRFRSYDDELNCAVQFVQSAEEVLRGHLPMRARLLITRRIEIYILCVRVRVCGEGGQNSVHLHLQKNKYIFSRYAPNLNKYTH